MSYLSYLSSGNPSSLLSYFASTFRPAGFLDLTLVNVLTLTHPESKS